MHVTSYEVHDAVHCVDHQDHHRGRRQDVDLHQEHQRRVRHQGERQHLDHQDEDRNQDVRQGRRGEHLGHQDVRQGHRGERHQDQDGNQDHQDVRQDQDGNLHLGHRGVRHQEVHDHQEVAEWGDQKATWGLVVAEWGDHQVLRHLGAAVACQEAAGHDLQEVRGALLAAG